jgi:very-short-patch-repair endonuclease
MSEAAKVKQRASLRRTLALPEQKERLRQALLARFPKMNGRHANTPLEVKLQNALIDYGISFETQRVKLCRFVVDIELTQASIIIEADGVLHQLDRNKAKDLKRDALLTAAGYRVFRFAGKQIVANPHACIEEIIAACGLQPSKAPQYVYNRTKLPYPCDWCGKDVWRTNYERKRGTHIFCNHECKGKWQSSNGYMERAISNRRQAAIHAWVRRREIKRQSGLHGDVQN